MAFVNNGLTTESSTKDGHFDPDGSSCEAAEIELRVPSPTSDNGSNDNASCSFENLGYNSSDMYKKIPTKVQDSPVNSRAKTSDVALSENDEPPSEIEILQKSKYNWKQFLPFAPR